MASVRSAIDLSYSFLRNQAKPRLPNVYAELGSRLMASLKSAIALSYSRC